MTTHIMVDVETLGLKPGAGIWQIGAVVLGNYNTGKFVCTINPEELMLNIRFRPEDETIAWQRSKNSTNYSAALELKDSCSPHSMLERFLDWSARISPISEIQFWSKGHFDQPHLEDLIKAYDLPIPWKYWQWNDLRTLCNFFDEKVPAFPGAHDALEDAIHQASHLEYLMKKYLNK